MFLIGPAVAVVVLVLLPGKVTRRHQDELDARVADVRDRELLFSQVHATHWRKREAREVFERLAEVQAELAGPDDRSLFDRVGAERWVAEEREALARELEPLAGPVEALAAVLELPAAADALAGAWPIAESLPPFQRLRGCVQLLCADAVVACSRGDAERAAEQLGRALDLVWIADDGSLVGLAARRPTEATVLTALQLVLAEPELDPAPLVEALGPRLSRHVHPERGHDALRSELELVIASAEKAGRRTFSMKDVLLGSERSLVGAGALSELLDGYLQLYELWSGPCLAEQEMLECVELDHPITRLSVTNAVTCLAGDHVGQRRLELARLALAVHAHRAARGAWPASLHELEGAWEGDEPEDPCGRGTFVYAPSDRGWTLGLDAGPPARDPHALPAWDAATRWVFADPVPAAR